MKRFFFKLFICYLFFVFASLLSHIHADDLIQMTWENGVYTIPCQVNGLPMKFIVDTGASTVSISITEAEFMCKNGWIKKNDIRGTALSQMANGDIEVNMKLNLREIKIGNRIIYNVEAVVSNSANAPLLLGQSVMHQLEPWSFENGYLRLKSEFDPEARQRLIARLNELDPLYQSRKAAEQGDANAQIKLGNHYYQTNDFTQALYWYKKAAEQGNTQALINIGSYYENKTYQSRSALYWYKKAADQGSVFARERLRRIFESIYPSYYGCAQRLYDLALSYQNGKGSPKSIQQAAYWYKIAAEKGNVKAQNNIGEFYYNGTGVAQSYEDAVYWWKKAANNKDPNAQYNLGECYYDGKGVEQSYLEAAKWYIEAAKQGHSKARNTLIKFFLISLAIFIITIFIIRKW